MEEKIDIKKFNVKKNKKGYAVELGMPVKGKPLIFSFFVSIILTLETLYNMLNGNIDIIMIIFDLFFVLFFLFANIFAGILIYSKETVKINSKELIISKKFFLYSNIETYELVKISDLKSNQKLYDNQKKKQLKRIIDIMSLRNGVIQFNYDGKEVRFGICLEASEGEYFIENHLNNYFSFSGIQ